MGDESIGTGFRFLSIYGTELEMDRDFLLYFSKTLRKKKEKKAPHIAPRVLKVLNPCLGFYNHFLKYCEIQDNAVLEVQLSKQICTYTSVDDNDKPT